MRFSVLIGMIVCILVSGCLEIPSQETLSTDIGTRLVDRCPKMIPAIRQQTEGLPATFKLTTWNLNKFQHVNWQSDMQLLAQENQILLLQEAVDRPILNQLLRQWHHHWQQIQAFRLEGEAIGVLNAAPASALYNCALRELEPVSRLPKSALLTLYPLANSNYPLLVINVHAINFELAMAAYRRQMSRLFSLAQAYPGPVVLAGDFATWGNKRTDYLLTLSKQSGFAEAIPDTDLRVLMMSTPIDHIFYRKLQLNHVGNRVTRASNHNPIWAEFSVLPTSAK